MPGAHNALNAAAATALALEAGAPFAAAQAALARFAGVARRLQFRGRPAGSRSSTTTPTCPPRSRRPWPPAGPAAGAGWCAVFQPHRYSRIGALWPDFAAAFGEADQVVVTDVYPAGEAPRPGVTGKLVVDAVLDAHPWSRWPTCPDGPISFRTWSARCGPATCA